MSDLLATIDKYDGIYYRRRILKTWNNNGDFLVHYDPDMDSILGLWVVYFYINSIYNISISEFVNRVRFVSSSVIPNVTSDDFGIDIGKEHGSHHIKTVKQFTIIYGTAVYTMCASVYLARELLPQSAFNIMESFLLSVNNIDMKGYDNTINKTHVMDLWTIIGAMRRSADTRQSLIKIIELLNDIYSAKYEYYNSIGSNILKSTFYDFNDIKVIAPPINTGKELTYIAKKYFRVDIIVFASYNDNTKLASLGFTMNNKAYRALGNQLNTLSYHPKLKKFMKHINHDVYKGREMFGRTNKSPFKVKSLNQLIHFRSHLIQAISLTIAELNATKEAKK